MAVIDPAAQGVCKEENRGEKKYICSPSAQAFPADCVNKRQYQHKDSQIKSEFYRGKWKYSPESPERFYQNGINMSCVPVGKSRNILSGIQKAQASCGQYDGSEDAPRVGRDRISFHHSSNLRFQ